MKKLILLIILTINSGILLAQQEKKGSIVGQLKDKEMENAPLPFANVIIKGTSVGATTDMDGYYALNNLDPGKYTLVFSFVGYESLELPVEVVAGKVTEVSAAIGSNPASLDEVVITTVSRKDSQVALLLEQKKAVSVNESIGSEELAKMGVSDAAGATAKIAGVTVSEASGDLFLRGLGDRYLYTTFNGLPIPSDDVERKNIDLNLFDSGILQNIKISKTYTAHSSADQASGTVNITSRELAGNQELSFGVKAGINSNVAGTFQNFKVSPNQEGKLMGFYSQERGPIKALTGQSWDPVLQDIPVNREYSISLGKRFGDRLRLFAHASQSTDFKYSKGLFREYRSNNLYDFFSDVEIYERTDNTTGLLDLRYNPSYDHQLKFTSLFINKLSDLVYESGRDGQGVVFEETSPSENLNQFVRDQNIEQTRLWVNQLHGEHEISEDYDIEWALGYNTLSAEEPSRIRNEVNIDGAGFVQLGRTGGFQQRKSSQEISDTEFNANLKNKLEFRKNSFLEIGGDLRNKQREFYSKFAGVSEAELDAINPVSIDAFSDVFVQENFEAGLLEINDLSADTYSAELGSYAGFVVFNYNPGPWNFNLGARYQLDELDVAFDVNNYPSTLPNFEQKSYSNVYPAANIKYSPTEKMNLRFAFSTTITLPEFKEIAPFEYVSPTGQITRGNPNLEASENINLDLKYEFFPSTEELFSIGAFYKRIDDPINRVQDRGAAGIFSFFNAGEVARVTGLEVSSIWNFLDSENPASLDFKLGFNVSRMWHVQDLKDEYRNGIFLRTFRYNGKEEVGLQGASDWILNTSISFGTQTENPFTGALVLNYSSDKIYALGAPEIQTQPDVYYNDEVIEEGFVLLDAVVSKQFSENWTIKLQGKNLLNPEIRRIQNIRPSSTGLESEEVVRSYTNGSTISIGINYQF